MRIGKRGLVMIAGIALLVGTGAVLFSRYWYYLPGIVQAITDPVQPNREIVWEEGPAEAAAPANERKPNIVVILVDDMGFNELTYGGGGLAGGTVPTPNMNSIAQNGAVFSNGYAGNATCAPSRAAIMTGRFATRFGFEFTPVPPAFARNIAVFANTGAVYHADLVKETPPVEEMSVPLSEIYIPQMLKEQGYRTLMLGKWHLGATNTSRPEARGFDEALGFMPGAALFLPKNHPDVVNSMQDFDPIDRFLWANLPFAIQYNGSKHFEPSEYMTDYLSNEAVKAIRANRNRPFFMYLAYNAPHTPLQALRSDYDALSHIEDHTLRTYAAMIVALDRGIGKVLDELRAQGLEENTIVIFSSDNGGANYVGISDLNTPYRGWKASFFEGGIHVPFFMKWPARIPAGTRLEDRAAHVDIFATAAAAAGAKLRDDRVYDGVDLMRHVRGESVPDRPLYFRSGGYRTLFQGDWKLQVSDRLDRKWLFNLAEDPTEQHNLAGENPEKLAEMTAALEAVDNEQAKPIWPSLVEMPVMIDRPLGGEPRGPEDEFVYWAN
ncbi:MAG: sulfatase-like hydrolase/transferase [Parvibaculaceae bacterium]|nr:sulfatase-like hydrolase/transferase [Parvibaculaceae bacterium]